MSARVYHAFAIFPPQARRVVCWRFAQRICHRLLCHPVAWVGSAKDAATRRFSFFARLHRRACCAPLLPRACPALSEHLTPAAPQRAPWQHRDGCRGSGTPARRTRSRSGALSRHALWPAARRLIFPIPAQGGAGHHRRARPVAASGTAPLVLRQAALRARRPARHRGWQPACLAHLPQRWARPPPQPPLHSADPRPSTFRAHQTVFMLCDVQTVSPPAPRGGWSGTRAPCWRNKQTAPHPAAPRGLRGSEAGICEKGMLQLMGAPQPPEIERARGWLQEHT